MDKNKPSRRILQVTAVEQRIILAALQQVLAEGRPGAVVELGCYAGDTSLELARVLHPYPDRQLYLYDSFAGLPAKTAVDRTDFAAGDLLVSKKSVRQRFLKAGLPLPVIKKAWFADLTPADLPEQIALAFLDGDFYQSIRDSLRLVGPKMVSGGRILVHDYGNPRLPGVAQAVDEWLGQRSGQIKETLFCIEVL